MSSSPPTVSFATTSTRLSSEGPESIDCLAGAGPRWRR